MTLVSSKAVFYHVPKTGGLWVRDALEHGGLHFAPIRCKRCAADGCAEPNYCCTHAQPLRVDLPNDGKRRFSFIFVRHPLTYLQSYWAFKMRVGWGETNVFDRQFANPDFGAFIWAVTRDARGCVSGLYEGFVGPQNAPLVDFIGKQETLRGDLLRALRLAGEDADEDAILRAPSTNEAATLPEWRDRCQYTPELTRMVMDAERVAIERFGYGETARFHTSLQPTSARSV